MKKEIMGGGEMESREGKEGIELYPGFKFRNLGKGGVTESCLISYDLWHRGGRNPI